MRTVGEPLEDVGCLRRAPFEARQIGEERVGEGDRKGVLDDGVPVSRETVDDSPTSAATCTQLLCREMGWSAAKRWSCAYG